jgi:hypothetical protein
VRLKSYESLSALIPLALVSGCASVVSGTSQQMTFQSSPEGATVTISGRLIGKTPITTTLKKEKNQAVVFSLDGYKPITMQLTTHLDNWFWGNIVIGGVIGSTTDGVTGAVYEYSPTQYYVTLTPDKKGADAKTSRTVAHEVRDFIVFRNNALRQELQNGQDGGENITSLLSLLGVSSTGKAGARIELVAIAEKNPDAVAFAEAVRERYVR